MHFAASHKTSIEISLVPLETRFIAKMKVTFYWNVQLTLDAWRISSSFHDCVSSACSTFRLNTNIPDSVPEGGDIF